MSSPAKMPASKPAPGRRPRAPFRTETRPEPSVFVAYGDYAPRPVIDGRAIGPYEMADMRRRAQLERDLTKAMRLRSLHRGKNEAAYRKADAWADRVLDLIEEGIACHRWER